MFLSRFFKRQVISGFRLHHALRADTLHSVPFDERGWVFEGVSDVVLHQPIDESHHETPGITKLARDSHLWSMTHQRMEKLSAYNSFVLNEGNRQAFSLENVQRAIERVHQQPQTELTGALYSSEDASLTDVLTRELMEQGAVCIGQTNTEWTADNETRHARNAHNAKMSAGGRCGGAGASIASGIGQFSVGMDIQGSMRVAAAVNGVVGFKSPIQWKLPCMVTDSGFATRGFITRSVRDLATVLGTLQKMPALRSNVLSAKPHSELRVGVLFRFGVTHHQLDYTMHQLLEERIEALRVEGMNITAVDGDHLHRLHRAMHRYSPKHVVDGIHHIFADCDVLITPTLPMTSFPNVAINWSGHAAVSVPIGYNDISMPGTWMDIIGELMKLLLVGAQVIAHRCDTASELGDLLWIAHRFSTDPDLMRPFWPFLSYGMDK